MIGKRGPRPTCSLANAALSHTRNPRRPLRSCSKSRRVRRSCPHFIADAHALPRADPWRPNSPLGARIMKTVEIHSQKPALYFLREAPAKGYAHLALRIFPTRLAHTLYGI